MKAFYLLLAVVIIFIVMMWSAKHDEDVAKASARYELCVHREYGMSPSQWYEEQGAYPVCEK